MDSEREDEEAINEGLEAEAAEARAAAAAAAPEAEAAAPPPPPPLPPPPPPPSWPEELAENAVEAADEEGLLTRPPHSTEVFVSGLARTTTEEELRSFAAPFGELFELRLVTDPVTGTNRGYAFVCYARRESAAAAAEEMNEAGHELKGRKLRAALSPSKHRLFLGGLPKDASFNRTILLRLLRRACVGVEEVELPLEGPPGDDAAAPEARNRGFAFVDFYNSSCAEKARRTIAAGFAVRGRTLNVSWAESKASEAGGAAALAAVKSLYVTGFGAEPTVSALRDAFARFGDVERVAMPPPRPGANTARFAFVHFKERAGALAALDAAEKPELDGKVLEVALAKPSAAEQQRASGPPPPSLGGPIGSAVAAATMGRGGVGAGGIAPRGSYGGPRGQMPLPPPPMMAPHGSVMVPVMMPNGAVGYMMQPQGGMGMAMGMGGVGAPPPFQPPPGNFGRGRGGGRGYGGGRGGGHARYAPY